MSPCDICGRLHTVAEVSCADEKVLAPLLDAIEWMGGSPDFAPGGAAHKGWLRMVAPLLEDYGRRVRESGVSLPSSPASSSTEASAEKAVDTPVRHSSGASGYQCCLACSRPFGPLDNVWTADAGLGFKACTFCGVSTRGRLLSGATLL